MEIRVLTREDAHVFREHRLESLEQDPRAFGESATEHLGLPLETISARLGSSENFVLGAFSDGTIVGTAGFFRELREKTGHKGRVWGVYVKPDWRNQGVGRLLLTELVRRARSQPGLEQVTLTVGSDQAAAKRLYISLGFEIFGHERHALKLGESYVDEDHMVLRFE
jgi:ribosomal protein S18 acetylase RimI-like enzyme